MLVDGRLSSDFAISSGQVCPFTQLALIQQMSMLSVETCGASTCPFCYPFRSVLGRRRAPFVFCAFSCAINIALLVWLMSHLFTSSLLITVVCMGTPGTISELIFNAHLELLWGGLNYCRFVPFDVQSMLPASGFEEPR